MLPASLPPLELGLPANLAVARLLTGLNQRLRNQEAGIIAGLDEAFLHNYRVALRRIRTVVSDLGPLLEHPADGHFSSWQEWLATIGRRTGSPRDLDVLLGQLPRYLTELPNDRRILNQCAAERGSAYRALVRFLSGEAYQRRMRVWQMLCDGLGDSPGRKSFNEVLVPAIEKAAARFEKRRRKLAAKQKDADQAVHRLRIQGKKLRYILEFAGTTRPSGVPEELISDLKGLQNKLGLLHDLLMYRQHIAASNDPSGPAVSNLLNKLDRLRERQLASIIDLAQTSPVHHAELTSIVADLIHPG